jgi:hypothetical protein
MGITMWWDLNGKMINAGRLPQETYLGGYHARPGTVF